MSVLLTEPTQQANDKVFKTAHVAFSVVTGTGRYVTGLKQFRDANPELCTEVSDQKAWAIHPSVIQVTPGFNSREMGMGDDYYKLPEVEEHIYNIKNAYIRGDYVDPIRVRVIDGVPFVRQGHCRLKAAMMACDEDHDITILCVEIKEDEIGCELATIDGNRGLALSPVALGESYRRLHSLAGWSLERIAQRENKSPTTISSLIRLTTCSVVIKKWIHADAISYVNVLSLIDELGETEAISRIKKMIAELEQADANGIYPANDPRGAADPNVTGWARVAADFDSGIWQLDTIKPGRVPFPDGRLMAPHISVWLVARSRNARFSVTPRPGPWRGTAISPSVASSGSFTISCAK